MHLGAMWRVSADKRPCPVAAFDSRRQRSFPAVGHAFQAGLWGGLAATHLGKARTQRGHGGHGGRRGDDGGSWVGEAKAVQIWFRLGSAWHKGGADLGHMWFRFGSAWGKVKGGSDLVQVWFRFGSAWGNCGSDLVQVVLGLV